ncbi:hypothetical protein [Cohnella fermenti]|uniref:YneQ n=1 Tax=Cohnella fermenti TaxID=2565925 RepID=A0A4V3WFA6_9BACL|nr:hypothetical protein [Cohnella fermenti]THF79540.1 hypothetical protein E6C55_12215 [Cohnella fermenti]
MAFGIKRAELAEWKRRVEDGEIAYLTHFWLDPRWPGITTVTKVGCSDRNRLAEWCIANGLSPRYIHDRDEYPHFDLIGPKQREILLRAGLEDQLARFRLL